MDLTNLTYLDLIELRSQVNSEISKIDEREKSAVYGIYSYRDWDYYIEKTNATKALTDLLADDEVIWDKDEFKTKMAYVDSAHLKYCKDYKEE